MDREQCNEKPLDKFWLPDIRVNKRRENEIVGLCDTHVRDKKCTQNFVLNI